MQFRLDYLEDFLPKKKMVKFLIAVLELLQKAVTGVKVSVLRARRGKVMPPRVSPSL